ncbi:MAG TPA: hypothetical protein VK173_02275, partial [Lacibacter sp.]|nr:hypothetical protein [Lacibacter sp.]
MGKIIKRILYTAASLFLLSKGIFAQTTFFVSPKGKNSNPGSIGKPFADIDYAKLKARNVAGSVVINLLEGDYHLKQPIVFTADDARKGEQTLTIKNFNNKKVTVSGSVSLKLKWKKYNDRIWQAVVMSDVLFDELFVNGKLQRMARYPNYDSTAR